MRKVQGIGVRRVVRGDVVARHGHDGDGVGGRVLHRRTRRVEQRRRARRRRVR